MVRIEYASPEEIDIRPERVKAYFGSKSGYYADELQVRDEIDELVDYYIKDIKQRLACKACYDRFPVSYKGDHVDMVFLKEKSWTIKQYLRNCDEIILFAATIGFDADRLIHKYSGFMILNALVADAVSSAAAEAWCNLLCSRFKEREAARGNITLPRFSIGYGDTDLAWQKNICSVLASRSKIGVYVTDSMVLIPSKSVTAVVPVKTNKKIER